MHIVRTTAMRMIKETAFRCFVLLNENGTWNKAWRRDRLRYRHRDTKKETQKEREIDR